jgi:hypothetical protein
MIVSVKPKKIHKKFEKLVLLIMNMDTMKIEKIVYFEENKYFPKNEYFPEKNRST